MRTVGVLMVMLPLYRRCVRLSCLEAFCVVFVVSSFCSQSN